MNNLKRVLSLGMAGAMLSGMAITANAAKFVDQDEITHTEAVNTLVALDIVNGKENNNFDPNGTVTRAEMAKMITVALNGGKVPVLGTKGTATFTDIKGHWAESFIEYCYNLKIIGGMGDGTFAPNAPVTGTQAAKMMLTAIGYDAEVQGYLGADWSLNVNTDANIAGLYEEIETINPNEALSRDDAAQLIYNGVQANMMVKTPSKVVNTGEITYIYEQTNYDLLAKKFDVVRTEGVLTAASYNSDKKEYTYTIGAGEAASYFKAEENFSDLFRQNVEVLSHKKNNDVYGIHAKDSKVLASAIVADFADLKAEDTEIKIDDVKYKLEGAVKAYNVMTNSADTLDNLTAAEFVKVDLIDNNDNGKVDVAVVYPVTVAKVNFVGSKNVTLATKAGANVASVVIKDAEIYDGIAKDDYVMVTEAKYTVDNTTVVEKMSALTGTVEATKGAHQFLIDGTWYTAADGVKMTHKDSYEFVVVNGLIVAVEKVDADKVDAKYAVVTDQVAAGGLGNLWDTELLLADGKTVIVKATEKHAAVGKLVTYKVDKDGNYELTELTLKGEEDTAFKDGKIGAHRIADNAVVFVDNGEKEYSVTTGAKLADTEGGVTVTYFKAEEASNGFSYVEVAFVTADKLGKTTDVYGYVTGDMVTYEKYATLNLNGKDIKTVENAEIPALTKGDVVTYTVNADGKIETISVVETLTYDAVIANDGKNMLFKTSNEGKVTDETVMIFVDAENNTVEEGNTVSLADEVAEGVYRNNVQVKLDDGNIVLLIVDINNNIECQE